FGFVRNHLDADLADELNIFVYDAKKNGEIKVTDNEIHHLHEAILSPKFNFGAPSVCVTEVGVDGALELAHEHGIDGRGLDTERGQKVIDYIHRVWRRPVTMHTLDGSGKNTTLETGKAAA
ncbi:MAG: stage V sporulation protein R, partial [Gammaproteobacteria bacterium]|nr:stage V sporulation protein R [Gammaproteobacteria bacterium]